MRLPLRPHNRSLVLPGSPGWDEPARVRTRSAWWERLLGGRSGIFGMAFGACRCGCGITICVKCHGTNVNGATVTVKSGSTTIASGTTSSGCVKLNVSAGTYSVTISGGSPSCIVNPFTVSSLTVASGGTYSIDCCLCGAGNCTHLPTVVFVSDGAGTTSCTWNGSGSWIGCTTINPGGSVIDGCNCTAGQNCTDSGGNVPITYTVSFGTSSPGNPACTISVSRTWGCCCGNNSSGTGGCCYMACGSTPSPPDCSGPLNSCAGGGSYNCPGSLVSEDVLSGYTQYSCIQFPVSVSLTLGKCGTLNELNSPLGPSMTVDV